MERDSRELEDRRRKMTDLEREAARKKTELDRLMEQIKDLTFQVQKSEKTMTTNESKLEEMRRELERTLAAAKNGSTRR
jgi:peptidoglycan hydrolase CwlO-like protein